LASFSSSRIFSWRSFWASAALAGACPERERDKPLFSFLSVPASFFAGGAFSFFDSTGFAVLGTGVGVGAGFETFAEGLETLVTGFLATGAAFFGAALGATFGTALGNGFLATGFFAGVSAFLTGACFTGDFFAGRGFLTPLTSGFLTGAFWVAGVGLADFPEDFRDEEGLEIFFNGEQCEA
ncbi:MAG: hypothetical protein ACOYOI_06945, partial [Chthoniobacterales bacterium]